jgi:hypothetical protein
MVAFFELYIQRPVTIVQHSARFWAFMTTGWLEYFVGHYGNSNLQSYQKLDAEYPAVAFDVSRE